MTRFLNSKIEVVLLSERIPKIDKCSREYQDRDHMIFRMQSLNMVVNRSLNMDLVLEFRWKTQVMYRDRVSMSQKNKFIPRLEELCQEIWAVLYCYLKTQDLVHMMNQVLVKLKAKIRLGHFQSHHDNTCTKVTVLVLGNIKLIKPTKVI
jgi:hypothetical protein